MGKILVVYKSKYGATKKYARWIADELNADIFEAGDVKAQTLMDYDAVIYGGGLYAGQINGVNLVAENPAKKLIVFTVGLADPKITDFTEYLAKSFAPERLAEIKTFHLRGAIEYGKLNLGHSMMMKMFKKMMQKKDFSQMSSEEKSVAEANGEDVDFVEQGSIRALVEYVRAQ